MRMECVVCEEAEGSVKIAELIGYGKDVLVCDDCYSCCDPVGEIEIGEGSES